MTGAAAGCVLAAGLALAGCGSAASSTGTATGTSSTDYSTASAGAATPSSGTPSPSTSAAAGGGSGSGNIASVPFPVALGNTWKFKITVGAENGTTVSKMTSVVPVSDGQQVTMTSTNDLLGSTTTTSSTYVFHSDGSIVYPLSQISSGQDVSVTGNGVVWPPASVIDSGTASHSDLKLSIKSGGQTISTTAHITVQGAGTQQVTVPAGTYTATVVNMTEAVAVDGFTVTIVVRTWLAPGVGPVKDEVIENEAGTDHVTATEELKSFTKG